MVILLNKKMKVWYLYHSGYAVETDECLLVFDYWQDTPIGDGRGLENGVFDPVHWLTKAVHNSEDGFIPPVIVFSSHKHGDHFNPEILAWQNTIPTIRYVLSQDIPKRYLSGIPKEDIQEAGNPENMNSIARIMRMKADQTFSWPELNMIVHSFKSTDAGIAFWVEINEKVVYHAGDLNLWVWNGESKSWNNNMIARYKKEVEKILLHAKQSSKTPDIAFFPTDPRLENHWLDGYIYFMEQVNAKNTFPMHFGDAFPVLESIKDDLRGKPPEFRSKMHIPKQRGNMFELPV